MAKPKATARNKMMDYLARRDHSVLEIRQKLKGKFEQTEIDAAIDYGKSHGWLPNSAAAELQLAEKAANELHRRKKGALYINNFLLKKGLPGVETDFSIEFNKALELVNNKLEITLECSRLERVQLKAKIGRFLSSRGFEMNIIMSVVRKVLYEK